MPFRSPRWCTSVTSPRGSRPLLARAGHRLCSFSTRRRGRPPVSRLTSPLSSFPIRTERAWCTKDAGGRRHRGWLSASRHNTRPPTSFTGPRTCRPFFGPYPFGGKNTWKLAQTGYLLHDAAESSSEIALVLAREPSYLPRIRQRPQRGIAAKHRLIRTEWLTPSNPGTLNTARLNSCCTFASRGAHSQDDD